MAKTERQKFIAFCEDHLVRVTAFVRRYQTRYDATLLARDRSNPTICAGLDISGVTPQDVSSAAKEAGYRLSAKRVVKLTAEAPRG